MRKGTIILCIKFSKHYRFSFETLKKVYTPLEKSKLLIALLMSMYLFANPQTVGQTRADFFSNSRNRPRYVSVSNYYIDGHDSCSVAAILHSCSFFEKCNT